MKGVKPLPKPQQKKVNAEQQQKSFQAAFLTLKSKVSEWVQQFIVIAPENGKIQYVSFLEENQMLTLGQELFYLVPEQGQFFAELAARQNNLGKVKTEPGCYYQTGRVSIPGVWVS